jgi:hypothetical protein
MRISVGVISQINHARYFKAVIVQVLHFDIKQIHCGIDWYVAIGYIRGYDNSMIYNDRNGVYNCALLVINLAL